LIEAMNLFHGHDGWSYRQKLLTEGDQDRTPDGVVPLES
jgi:hypothetical protein